MSKKRASQRYARERAVLVVRRVRLAPAPRRIVRAVAPAQVGERAARATRRRRSRRRSRCGACARRRTSGPGRRGRASTSDRNTGARAPVARGTRRRARRHRARARARATRPTTISGSARSAAMRAVPCAQLLQRALRFSLRGLVVEQLRQQLARTASDTHVGLHARRSSRRCASASPREQLPRCGWRGRAAATPSEVMRVARRRDLVVRGDDRAAGGLNACGSSSNGDVAGPVVARVPARRGREALQVVVGLAHRHAAGGDEADVAVDVGVHHVLLRRVEVARGGEELVQSRARPRRRRGLQREVVLGERGPAKREHVAARRGVARSAASTSEITGPWRETRTASFSSARALDLIVSSARRTARGPSGVR